MKKVFISMAIAALCLCSCGNNSGNKKAEEGEAAQTECCETKAEECCGEKEGECCGECNKAEGECANCEKAAETEKAE